MPERLCYSLWFSTRSNFASQGTLDHVWTHFSLTHELWMGEFATGLYRGETGNAGEVINHWVQLLKRTPFSFPGTYIKRNVCASSLDAVDISKNIPIRANV